MIEPDPMDIRRRIEKYTEDRDLQMLFKAVYLLGAMECEMLGKKYPSDEAEVYGPTGADAWEKPVFTHDMHIDSIFFRIKTARKRTKNTQDECVQERIVVLPKNCEPWAKELLDYFKEREHEIVFPIERQKIYPKVKKTGILQGLEKVVTYKGNQGRKALGLDNLRWIRKRELEDEYGFDDSHLEAYGIISIDRRRTPDKRLDDPRIDELRKEYLWKLCKYPEPEEEDNNLLFVDGKKIVVDSLIEKGENEKVEFKSSLCWDYEKKKKSKDIEVAVAKAVQSFLNSDGGFVLIGVRDDKTLLGLEADFGGINKPTTDAFELHFTTVIGNYLGAENAPYITMRFAERKGEKIAIVVIPKKAPKEVFLWVDGVPSFNIRLGNSSRPLNMKDAVEYIRQHWQKTKYFP